MALTAAVLLTPAVAMAAPTLPRVTTISGDRSGYVEVELTQSLRPFGEDVPEVNFDGGGRVIGIAIRALPDRWGNGSPLFTVYRAAGATFRGGDGETLVPGRYRLYLIAEQPGAARIEFGALPEGTLALRPEVDTPQRSGAIPLRASNDNIVKFSDRVSLWGGGVTFMTVFPTPGIGTELELCTYWPEGEDEAGASAYDPGCPGGYSAYQRTVMSEGEGAFTFSSTHYEWLEGLGGNVTTLQGSPGPVETYLFAASYEIGRPASAQDPPSTPPTWEGGPTAYYPGPEAPPTVEDPPPSEPPPQSEPARPTGPCSAEGCSPPSDEYALQPTPQGRGTATLASRLVRVRGTRGRVRLACSAIGPCRGLVGFLRGRSTRFSIAPTRETALPVRIPRAVARRLRRRATIRAWILVSSELFSGTRQSRTRVRVRRS